MLTAEAKRWESVFSISAMRFAVPNYGRAEFDCVYPGVDLIFYGNQQQLDYDLVVHHGADPRRIRMKFQGMDKLAVDTTRELVLSAAGHEIRAEEPVVYQTIRGARKEIAGRYVLNGRNPVRSVRSKKGSVFASS